MSDIPALLTKLLASRFTMATLADALGVTSGTISRWCEGQSKPRPSVEGQIRDLTTSLNEDEAEYRVDPQPELGLSGEFELRRAVDLTLREIREALHRRARLSSRGEALEEVSKLLFAHIVSIGSGGPGIGRDLLRPNPAGAASNLKQFVQSVFDAKLPKSIAHELPLSEFALKLKPNECELAADIIAAFEKLFGGSRKDALAHVDILNDVFGRFLSDSFADEKQLGQYLTPPEVVKFMIELALLELRDDEKRLLLHPARCAEFGLILDPSCGVGSFLAEFVRRLHPTIALSNGIEAGDRWITSMMSDVIAGIDKSERMVKLALTNMAMFGLPAAHLQLANAISRRGDSANATKHLNGRAGLILTNPPFGAEFSAEDTEGSRIARSVGKIGGRLNSEVLFMERYLEWLKPGGQLVAVVPDSVLTNKGVFEVLRNQLKAEIEIRNVISLPSITFASSGTTTKTSILHLRKLAGETPKRPTVYAICSDVGYTVVTRGSQRSRVNNGASELPAIIRAIQSRTIDGTKLREVENAESAARWDAGFHAAISAASERRLHDVRSSDLRVSDIAELSNERTDPRRFGAKMFRYIEISDVDSQSGLVSSKLVSCEEAPSRARRLVRSGDVLVSTVRPDRRAIGVVTPENDGAVCTTGFAVLRPKAVHPLVLASLLRSDFATIQILRNNIGIAYPAIEEGCLLGILLPITREEITPLEEAAEKLLLAEVELRDTRARFGESMTTAVSGWK